MAYPYRWPGGADASGPEAAQTAIDQINTAYERMLRSDVRYRFVIDMDRLAA